MKKLHLGIKALLTICGLIACVFVILYAKQLYKDANPQSYINFTQLNPTKIVGDLQINNKILETWAPDERLWFMPNEFNIHLVLNRDGSYISESKTSAKNVQLDSFQCSISGVKCSSQQTNNNQIYTLYRYYDSPDLNQTPIAYDKLLEEWAYFIKDGTGVLIRIKANSATPIPDSEWSQMIDSFTPTTFGSLKVKHMYPGP